MHKGQEEEKKVNVVLALEEDEQHRRRLPWLCIRVVHESIFRRCYCVTQICSREVEVESNHLKIDYGSGGGFVDIRSAVVA